MTSRHDDGDDYLLPLPLVSRGRTTCFSIFLRTLSCSLYIIHSTCVHFFVSSSSVCKLSFFFPYLCMRSIACMYPACPAHVHAHVSSLFSIILLLTLFVHSFIRSESTYLCILIALLLSLSRWLCSLLNLFLSFIVRFELDCTLYPKHCASCMYGSVSSLLQALSTTRPLLDHEGFR
ncbi:hypothetical protein FA15DRAFT_459584 [Coprinopsis marcescibilis]|uniref:Uncharacterized protein n=1 Tax=Coprinopsis marcescibilis TaxID=230819 RepID=A0A5C3KSS9_COPMA|nr:hypothetical protein FA15DRAFT_459584 [Coprinopsis marcescibilis]